jgi:hypothetical protein
LSRCGMSCTGKSDRYCGNTQFKVRFHRDIPYDFYSQWRYSITYAYKEYILPDFNLFSSIE